MKVTLLAAPDVMLNVLLVAEVSPLLVAVRVYEPVRLRMGPVKAATPAVALTDVVPDRTAPVGPEVIARVTLAVEVVTVLPLES